MTGLGIGLGLWASRGRVSLPSSTDYPSRWGVVAHWPLDEVSAGAGAVTRADAHGANDLTDNNTVTNAVGKIAAQCAQFTSANNEYLSIADNASLSVGPGVSYWGAGWFLFDALAALRGLVSRRSGTAARDWGLFFDTNNPNAQRIKHRIYDAAGTEIASVPYDVALSTATWYFVVWYYDAVNHLIGISVNGSAYTTVSTGVSEPADTAANFLIGILQAGTTNPHSGRAESVTFGKDPPLGIAALRDEIRDTLYNGGAGRPYPFS